MGRPAWALPSGAQVTQGTASLQVQGTVLTVTNSVGTVIHWDQFSIAAGETARFVQPSASSQVLNRVIGGNPSQILGSLESNGQVFLLNANGIAFGRGSQVNVAGLVASTLKLDDADFLAGRLNFGSLSGTAPGTSPLVVPGAVQQQGTIQTPSGGFVYLLAPQVENTGIIRVAEGKVLLAAGHKVSIASPLTPEVSWEVSAPPSSALNLGDIAARRVGLIGQGVSNAGLLSATTAVAGEDGRIMLRAAGQLQQTATGRMTAQRVDAQGQPQPGLVELKAGQQVSLQGKIEQASIDIVQESGTLALGPLSTPGTLRASAPAGDVLLQGALSAGGGGDALVLQAGGRFINETASPTALSISGTGARWLVYSNDPTLDSPGPLAPNFREYGRLYAASSYDGPGQGNGFLHSRQAPSLALNLSGNVSKVYDRTTEAALGEAQVAATGLMMTDETATLAVSAAQFDTKNAGTGKLVTANVKLVRVTAVTASGGSVVVHGYTLERPTVTAAVGSILPRPVSLSGVRVADRTYDGTDVAQPDVSQLQTVGVVGGDIDISATVTARFSSAAAGSNKQVLLDYSLTGGDAANYTASGPPSTTASILPAPLTISAVSQTKVYDGFVNAPGAPVVTGQVFGSDTLQVAQAFSSKDVRGPGLSIINPFYVLKDGQGGANYAVTLVTSAGTILPKALTLSGVLAKGKVYDGTTSVVLDTSRAQLSGALPGDAVGFLASGAFTDRWAGNAKAVNVTARLQGAQAGNYQLENTSLLTVAAIERAPLTLSGLQVASKVYDGNTLASPLTGTLMLQGVLGTDSVRVSTAGWRLDFSDKNVGQAKAVTVSGLGLSGPDAANYRLTPVSGLSANIEPRALGLVFTARPKVYDGTTQASVSLADNRVAGDQLSITYAAAFGDRHVGSDKPVEVTAVSVTGADASNYRLQPVLTPKADITVRPLSTWTAAVSGLWSNPANWDVLPESNNVAAVNLPAGNGLQVTFDAAALPVQLQSLSNAARLLLAASGLQAGQVTNSGVLTVGPATTLNLAGGSVLGEGSLLNSGTLQMAGTRVTNEVVNAGVLEFSGTNALNSLRNSGLVQMRSGTTNLSGTFIQTSGRTLLGPATGGEAAPALSVAQGVQLEGGTLEGNGAVVGTLNVTAGTLAPGFSAGALSVQGDLLLSSSSTLAMELAGTGASGADRLAVSGQATLDGTLQLSSLGGFVATPSDRFTLLQAGSLQGRFSQAQAQDPNLAQLSLSGLLADTPQGLITLPIEGAVAPVSTAVETTVVTQLSQAQAPTSAPATGTLTPPPYVAAPSPQTAPAGPQPPSGEAAALAATAASTPAPPGVIPDPAAFSIRRNTLRTLELDLTPGQAATTSSRPETSEVSHAKPVNKDNGC
jgi:filamentous hemagglutinin family protein